jgi:hypothetical protein
VEAADGFGEALFDVHPAGVALDERFGGSVVVVGDQDGGLVVAQAADDQLPDGAGVAGQVGVEGLGDLGAAVLAGPVQGNGTPGGRGDPGGDRHGHGTGPAAPVIAVIRKGSDFGHAAQYLFGPGAGGPDLIVTRTSAGSSRRRFRPK